MHSFENLKFDDIPEPTIEQPAHDSEVKEGETESAEHEEQLLESIAKKGRYVVYGYMIPDSSNKVVPAASRGWSVLGSKDFNSNQNVGEGQRLQTTFSAATGVLKEMNIEAAIYIQPVSRKEEKYEEYEKEVEIPSTGWFSKPKKEIKTERRLVGEIETRQKIHQFNGDKEDQSNASRLGVLLSCTRDKNWSVLANRPGGYMMISLILPENLAESAYDEIQQDPRLITQILEKIEPGLISAMHVPDNIKNFEKILVVPRNLVPEDMLDVEVVSREGRKAKGLKSKYNTPEFVKTVK